MRSRVWLLAALLVSLVPGLAQDLDGDGLTTAQEELLGADPTVADSFVSIVTDKANDSVDPRRDVVGVEQASLGGNRFVWRVTFAEEFDPNTILHLYIDADGDVKTGRQNNTGTEYMLTHDRRQGRVTAYAPNGDSIPGPAGRALIAGKQLYLGAELDLKQVDGRSRYRLFVLCERLDPHVAVDSTAWVAVDGPGISPRPKVRLDSDVSANEGFRPLRGLQNIFRLKADQANRVISIREAKLQGFVEDTTTEYRGISTMRTGAEGSTVTFTIPAPGRWFLGVQLYDGPGAEKLRVDLNGQRVGYLVATADPKDLVLFSSEKPYDLRAGDTLELKALTSDGTYRIEELLLLKAAPPAWQPKYEVTRLEATDVAEGTRVTFMTSWPVQATVELTRGGKTETVTEDRAVQNHRVWFAPAAEAAAKAQVVVKATGGDGSPRTAGPAQVAPAYAEAERRTGSARRETVSLRLLNAEVVPPQGWPVKSGVPLPRGAVFSARQARLLAGGQELPARLTATCRWPDGSLRWLLVEFVARPSHGDYALEYGSQVATSPVAAAAGPWQDGRLRLADGRLAYDADGNGQWSEVEQILDLREPDLRLVDGGDAPLPAARGELDTRASTFGFEASAGGRHGSADGPAWQWQLELEAFNGTPAVRLMHTWTNGVTSAMFSRLRSLGLQLRLPNSGATIGGDQAIDLGGQPGALRQAFDNVYELKLGEAKATAGKRAAGWAAVKTGDSTVAVVPRDFWQHWPKGIAVDPTSVRVDFLPDIRDVPYGTDFYDLKKPDHRLYYLFDQGSYKLKAGCSKRQELWLTFGIEPEAAARAVNNPPFLAAEPVWYQQTGAFGEISIEDQKAYPSYETSTAKALDEYLASRERNQEYGVLNFGDWYGERGTNWGNIEYDTQHAFFMQFARSGDLRWLLAGEQAERHNQDVDTVWAGPNRGLVYAHCLGHVGDYLDARVGEMGSRTGGFTVSHTWCEGHAEYYYLTGDRRARDTAVMIADAYARKNEANYDFTNCRDSGWHLILQCAVYELTGDPYYLNMARTIVDRVEERQTADGGWERQLVPGHCTCDPPRHRGNAGFMVGVQLSGLKSYHLLTAEPRVIDVLYRGSKFLIEDMWVPAVHGFRYTSCPKSSAGYWSNTMLFEGMAYADRFKPDPAVQSILREGCEAQLSNIQAFGKSLSMNIRATPRILFDMERLDREDLARGVPVAVAGPNQYLGLGAGDEARFDASGSHDRGKGRLVAYNWDFGDGTRGEGVKVTHRYEKPGQFQVVLTVKDDQGHTARSTLSVTAAPQWVRRLDPDKVVLIEAESFTGQGGGAVQLFERVATSGKMLTKWHQELGHWLEWKVAVPAAGKYQLAARYCTDFNGVRRKVEVDGKVPREDLAAALFPRTGGFSTGKDDYQFLLLGGEANPLILDLTAGEHTVRMTNLGEGLGLDYLLLVPAA